MNSQQVVGSFGAEDERVEEIAKTSKDPSDKGTRVGDRDNGADATTGLLGGRGGTVLELSREANSSSESGPLLRVKDGELTKVPE